MADFGDLKLYYERMGELYEERKKEVERRKRKGQQTIDSYRKKKKKPFHIWGGY